jgi:hypothetical protein
MPTPPDLSTHSARKSHITTLAHTYFTSPTFQPLHHQITQSLIHAHTPSYSNPHPTLERRPTWKTCWSTIVYKDEKDDQWWAPIPLGSLPNQIQSIGLKILNDLRGLFSFDLARGTNDCQVHTEETYNPFHKPSSDLIWSIAKYTQEKRLIRGDERGWTYRLKVILRWTDGSWLRFRERAVWVEFHVPVPAPSTTTTMTTKGMITQDHPTNDEIQHLEYAEIEYNDEKPLHRTVSMGSDRTLIGSGEGMEMGDEEVKLWASQFGKGGKGKR